MERIRIVGVVIVIYGIVSFLFLPQLLFNRVGLLVLNYIVGFWCFPIGLWLIIKKPKISKVCNSCGKKIGLFKKKIKMADREDKKLFYCEPCYSALSNEEKLNLRFAGDKTSLLNIGLLFGIFGAIGGASGRKSSIERTMKKCGITERDMDERSINRHGKHFWLLSQSQQNDIQREFVMEKKRENVIEEIKEWELEADSQKEQLAQSMYGKRFEDCTYKEMKKIKKKLKREVKPSILKFWK